MAPMRDSTEPTPRDRLLAGAAVAAPALLLASTAAYVAGDGLGEDATGGAIQVWAAIALGLAVVGLTRELEPRLPRLAAALSLTGMVGTAGATAWAINAMVYAADPAAAVSEATGPEAGLALFVPGIVLPLTLAAIGAATARSGAGPRVPGILLALGGLCFPVSRIGGIEPLALVADALIAGGMIPMGLALLRRPRPVAVLRGAEAVAA